MFGINGNDCSAYGHMQLGVQWDTGALIGYSTVHKIACASTGFIIIIIYSPKQRVHTIISIRICFSGRNFVIAHISRIA